MSTLAIIPVTSEKAYMASSSNTYIFAVPTKANKQQISAAVSAQYGVTVTNVTSLIQKGKAIAFSKGKRARPGITLRKNVKKAYVTLASGDSIKLFDEAEEADAKKPATAETKTAVANSPQKKSATKLRSTLRRGSDRGGNK